MTIDVVIDMPPVVPVGVMNDRDTRRIGYGMDAECAVDPADDAADHAADKSSDRTRVVAAHISTMSGAVGNPLRLRRQRTNQRCGEYAGDDDMQFHAMTPLVVCVGISPRRPQSRRLRGTIEAADFLRTSAANETQSQSLTYPDARCLPTTAAVFDCQSARMQVRCTHIGVIKGERE